MSNDKGGLPKIIKKQLFYIEKYFNHYSFCRKTEAASKLENQDLIIINKYYNKLAYFHNGYIGIVDSVATGKKWDKTPVGFF
ncbi:L,D-transpeptidase [Priestia aryabhattai]|uniref:L,D-transpeptidase n=1 Tax=Priestia aryabhattai TaxID=412384 RepID=UPI00398E429F